jgi:hypothetical protein
MCSLTSTRTTRTLVSVLASRGALVVDVIGEEVLIIVELPVALLCRRTAKSGGTSKVVSSIAMREAMQEKHPELMPVLESNKWFHSYQGAQDPSQPPYYRCPIFGTGTATTIARTNRKDTTAAQRDFPEVPRMSEEQTKALDSEYLAQTGVGGPQDHPTNTL